MLKVVLIIVATEKPGRMIGDYGKCWSIEALSGNLKSRGFYLESTHMKNRGRMDKLMGLLMIAVV
ncbi:MAG: hypothetical protein QS721_11275 [Candidatus Endonucleobacter sp. (ex Gigantidas childressi)]|nr:hypothetical protein [Candidatus Endonucleobacter sp. (ex Gigantidas childressi)]